MRDPAPVFRPWVMPSIIGAGYFIFAWSTISRAYTFDAISYLLDVSRTQLSLPLHGDRVAYNFFHSQHLLFSLTVYLFHHTWALLGYDGSELLSAQVLNLLEGSVTIALVFTLLRAITRDSLLAFLFSLLLGFTFAFWDNTAMVSDHMASCLMAALFFRALLSTDLRGAEAPRIAFLGFLNGAAFLMHQVNGLLGVVFLAALAAEGFRASALAVYLLAAALTSAIPYLLVGVVLLGNTTLHDFAFWCFYYAMPGVIDVTGHYGTVGLGKVGDLLAGFGGSVVGGFYWMNRVFETRPIQRYGVPVLCALAAIFFLTVLLRARFSRTREKAGAELRKATVLSAAWFLAYALLLYWWWPSYYQLWAVPLTGLVIFLGAQLHRNLGARLVRRGGLAAALFAASAFVASANAIAAYWPSHAISNNDYYVTTMEIRRATAKGDLIVVPGDDEYEIYIPYFAGREAVSLHALLVEHLNNLDESIDDLRESMDRVWGAGHHVYVVSELRDSAVTYRDLYDLHHLTNESVGKHFREFETAGTVETRSLTLYLLREPEGQ